MGKFKKTQKFGKKKRQLSTSDPRLIKKTTELTKRKLEGRKLLHRAAKPRTPATAAAAAAAAAAPVARGSSNNALVKHVPQASSALFFQFNTQLGPPYHVLLDTNFINFAIQNKIEIVKGMMDCLFAKCVPIITDCVMGELEKMGPLFRVALRIVRDPRFERLPCAHKGTYADDCLVQRVSLHRCYIVATCDKDLKRRIRKIPGVPIMYITQRKFSVERMPDAVGNLPRM
eukprot:TRINITY_DN3116_c0_g1_i2.p2 TRINITY_DN3116_c0_g1~~TRINITY_DN3116_c0_g1_i2.p2  ORF type:complete len:230 (+),score=83.28 TRINITY_DN3116_c0_g1_i2:70-759(+)